MRITVAENHGLTTVEVRSGTPGRSRQDAVRSQAGFTLLELMAVLVLMTLLLGLVLPSLFRSWEREKNRAALRELTAALRTARSEAVTGSLRCGCF